MILNCCRFEGENYPADHSALVRSSSQLFYTQISNYGTLTNRHPPQCVSRRAPEIPIAQGKKTNRPAYIAPLFFSMKPEEGERFHGSNSGESNPGQGSVRIVGPTGDAIPDCQILSSCNRMEYLTEPLACRKDSAMLVIAAKHLIIVKWI